MKNRKKKSRSRKRQDVHQFLKRAGWKDGHHILIPGGETISSNLFLFDVYRHDAWHLLFGNKKLDEIISLLWEMKSIESFLESFKNDYKYDAFQLLFGRKTFEHVISLLKRVRDIKKSQQKKYTYKIAA